MKNMHETEFLHGVDAPSNQEAAVEYPEFDPEQAQRLQLEAGIAQVAKEREYSPELTETLIAILPEFAEYHDDPELVMQTLKECPIHMQEPGEKANEFLQNYLALPDFKFPTIASGAFFAVPAYDENNNLVLKKLLYLRRGGDLQEPGQLSLLTHELGHAIATTDKTPVQEADGRVRVRIGLSSEFYRLNEDGTFVEDGDENGGIEEMLNTVAENHVMQKVLHDEGYRSTGYRIIQDVARLMPAEVLSAYEYDRTHDTQTVSQLIPPENQQQAEQNLDRVVANFTLSFSELQQRGGKQIAAENRELAQQAVDLYSDMNSSTQN